MIAQVTYKKFHFSRFSDVRIKIELQYIYKSGPDQEHHSSTTNYTAKHMFVILLHVSKLKNKNDSFAFLIQICVRIYIAL